MEAVLREVFEGKSTSTDNKPEAVRNYFNFFNQVKELEGFSP